MLHPGRVRFRRLFFFLFSLASCLFASFAAAQLGETSAQIARRYGPVVRLDNYSADEQANLRAEITSPVHSWKGFLVGIEYLQGRAAMVVFLHPTGFTRAQVQALIRPVSRAKRWAWESESENSFSRTQTWRSLSDSSLLSIRIDLDKGHVSMVTLTSRAWRRHLAEIATTREAARRAAEVDPPR